MSPTPANSCALGASALLPTVALVTTQDGAAGLNKAIPESTACKTPLLDLAAELHVCFVEMLDNESLLSFRQVSRKLEKNSNNAFLDRFFTQRHHLLTTKSMQVLAEISAAPAFSRHIEVIELVAFQADDSLTYVKEVRDWFSEAGAKFCTQRLALFHDVLQNLARLGSSPIIKIKPISDGFFEIDDNIFHRNHIEDGHGRGIESIYGVQDLRARVRPLWALAGIQEDLLLDPYDVTAAAQDFVLALADYPQVVKHLELGPNSFYNVDSAKALPRLTSTQAVKLRLALANITTLRIGIHVFARDVEELRFIHRQTSAVLYLLHAAVNVTTLDILLQPGYDMRAIWAEVAHLNLRSIGVGGCSGSYQSLTEILSQHRSTLEVLRLDEVCFIDAPSGPVRLLSWIGGNLNLKQFSVHECCAFDEEEYEDNLLFNGSDESSFVLITKGDGTVSDKLKDAESWAYLWPSSEAISEASSEILSETSFEGSDYD